MYTGGDPHHAGSAIAQLLDMIRGAKGVNRGKPVSRWTVLAKIGLMIFMMALPFILILSVIILLN